MRQKENAVSERKKSVCQIFCENWEMGLNPKSLIKNIPNKKEMWKAPVKDWIHDMYEKRQRKSEQKAKRKKENKQ